MYVTSSVLEAPSAERRKQRDYTHNPSLGSFGPRGNSVSVIAILQQACVTIRDDAEPFGTFHRSIPAALNGIRLSGRCGV